MSKTITTLQLIATRKIKQHKNPMYREKGVSLQTKPHTMTRKDFEIMTPVGSQICIRDSTSEATIRELIHMPENIYHSKSGSVYARYDMLDFMDEESTDEVMDRRCV